MCDSMFSCTKKLIELAGGCCNRCKATESLQFNHIDPSTKLFTLSAQNLYKNWSQILLELEKCELLCRQCHLAETKKQFAEKTLKVWNDGISGPFICGTARSYHKNKCRCADCSLARKLYYNKKIGFSEIVKA